MLYGANGEFVPGRLVGTFGFEHRHSHLHLSGFAHYELWALTPDGSLLEPLAENDKVGSCLMDKWSRTYRTGGTRW